MENQMPAKKNWGFIIGILILCVGMQFANYGTAVCMSGEVAKMDAMQYYVLIAALGTLGMVLVLPIVGKLTAILGQRNIPAPVHRRRLLCLLRLRADARGGGGP